MSNILPIAIHNQFEKVDIDLLNRNEQNHLINLALSVLSKRNEPGQEFTDPKQMMDYLQLLFGECRNEEFGVIFLNSKNRLLKTKSLFFGTIDGASVYPRVVVENAMQLNAKAVVFYHNHPSGTLEPSNADKAITKRLRDALEFIDVRVLDHFLVSSQGSYSFAQHSLI